MRRTQLHSPIVANIKIILSLLCCLILVSLSSSIHAQNKKTKSKSKNTTEVPVDKTQTYRMSHDRFMKGIGVQMSKRCEKLYFELVKMEETLNWTPHLFKVYKNYSKKCEKEVFGPARRSRIPTSLAGQWLSVRPVLIRMKKSKKFRRWLLKSIGADTPLPALRKIQSNVRGDCPKGFKKQCGQLDRRVKTAMREGREKGYIQLQSE